MVRNLNLDKIRFDGGTMALDFINTVHDRTKDEIPDYLHHAIDLAWWARRAGIVDLSAHRELEEWILTSKSESTRQFSQAIILREHLYRLFLALATGKRPPTEELDFINEQWQMRVILLRLEFKRGSFHETWNYSKIGFDFVIAPVLKDAYSLLLNGALERIRECPNCGWLFQDISKNGKRRWCSMDTCGSLVKSLNYYYRKKEENS